LLNLFKPGILSPARLNFICKLYDKAVRHITRISKALPTSPKAFAGNGTGEVFLPPISCKNNV
jgi:hypothetical protein